LGCKNRSGPGQQLYARTDYRAVATARAQDEQGTGSTAASRRLIRFTPASALLREPALTGLPRFPDTSPTAGAARPDRPFDACPEPALRAAPANCRPSYATP